MVLYVLQPTCACFLAIGSCHLAIVAVKKGDHMSLCLVLCVLVVLVVNVGCLPQPLSTLFSETVSYEPEDHLLD